MTSSYYDSRVPGRSAIQHDDPDQRAADRQQAVFQPLAAKAARGEQLTPYEQGALRAVALGRGPRHVAQAAGTMLAPYERRSAPSTGLSAAQVEKAIQRGIQQGVQQIQDAIRDAEDDR